MRRESSQPKIELILCENSSDLLTLQQERYWLICYNHGVKADWTQPMSFQPNAKEI
jgi:hypothetical protein